VVDVTERSLGDDDDERTGRFQRFRSDAPADVGTGVRQLDVYENQQVDAVVARSRTMSTRNVSFPVRVGRFKLPLNFYAGASIAGQRKFVR